MPISYRIDKSRRLVELLVSGEFDTTEILQTVDSIVAEPDFQPGFEVISDNRGVTRPISTEQVLRLAAHLSQVARDFGGARVAFVTGSAASFGMMRMFASLAEEVPINARVFGDMESAREWLATPPARE